MTPKEKAEELLHKYRMLFMNEGDDYGEEILVSILSERCALITCNEVLGYMGADRGYEFWTEVKQEINKLT